VPFPDVTQSWVVEIVKVQDILHFVISGYLRDPNETKICNIFKHNCNAF